MRLSCVLAALLVPAASLVQQAPVRPPAPPPDLRAYAASTPTTTSAAVRPAARVVHGGVGQAKFDPSDRVIGRRAPPTTALKAAPRESAAPQKPTKRYRAAGSDESMRWYLENIGRQRLLTPEEVTSLAGAIQKLLRWEAGARHRF